MPRALNDQEHARIDRLIAAMTVPEKIGQLTMVSADWAVTGPVLSPDYAQAVGSGAAGSVINLWGRERVAALQRVAVTETRLGVPLLFGFDVLHGMHTIFPVPLAEAGSFDRDLWRRTAAAQAAEAAADGINLVFSPMLDIARDPRWGRGIEGPGEAVRVAVELARAKVAGTQATGIAACAKHLAAYGAVLAGREYASADVSERDLHDIYLPPFRAAIEADVLAIMPAFQDLGGVPMTAHRRLLRGLVRERWGFEGVLISDYAALAELIVHGVAEGPADAAALALEAGIDIDLLGVVSGRGIGVALDRGLVAPARLDEAVRRVLALKTRLGLFDDPGRMPPATDPAPRRDLAREAAIRSAVLLRNQADLLPLDPSAGSLALVGPHADSLADLNGPWAAVGRGDDVVSCRAGLAALWPAGALACHPGCGFDADDDALLAAALAGAKAARTVVLCLGEPAAWSGEAASRGRIELPTSQRRLADQVLALGRPTVLALFAGRPLILGDLAERADAILMLWFPGQAGGTALADLLTGRVSPSGRLPVSWPIDQGQIPIFHDRRPTGRPPVPDTRYAARYLDLPVEPLYPFGAGLGYTRFEIDPPVAARRRIGAGDLVSVEIRITNVGRRPGETVLFLFARDPVASVARPELELKAFERVALDRGASAIVRFDLPAARFAFATPEPDDEPVLEPGRIELKLGWSADPTRLKPLDIELI